MSIGEKIAELRRQKGITQEVLAKAAGVSPPAVSKWENGGSPDIELLPAIADFFGISIDELFGREVPERADVIAETIKTIADAPFQERLKILIDYAWMLHLALTGADYDDVAAHKLEISTFTSPEFSINAYNSTLKGLHNTMMHSLVKLTDGFSRVRLNAERMYFLLMPKPDKGWEFVSCEAYSELFADLADEMFLKIVVYMHQNPRDAFTAKWLEREFELSEKKTLWIIERLKEYRLINEKRMTLDDSQMHYYEFKGSSAFVPFLTFAEELMQPAHSFYTYMNAENNDS